MKTTFVAAIAAFAAVTSAAPAPAPKSKSVFALISDS